MTALRITVLGTGALWLDVVAACDTETALRTE